jgi:hypothetical protein
MSTAKQHNEYVKRYRNQESKYRLELMITPELNERYKALPGLQGKTHAERFAALCAFWEQHHVSPLSPDSASIEGSPAPATTELEEVPHFPSLPADPSDLDLALQKLEAFDAELSAEEIAEESSSLPVESKLLSLWDEPLPDVPPLPEKRYYVELDQAITQLYQREWHRQKHGNSEEAKRWKRLLRAEPALLKAFLTMTQNRKQLGELIKHYCLAISPNELLAWFSLEEDDRQAVLWYLAHAGIIHPEALGQIGDRFKQARDHQPRRHFLTWQPEAQTTL